MARASGEGTTRKRTIKRADGTNYVRFFAVVSVPGSGKRIEGPWRKTQREANADRRQMVAEAARQAERGLGSMLVSDWLDEWLERRLPEVRENTQKAYERTIRLHLKPEFGHQRLDELTPYRVQQGLENIAKQKTRYLAKYSKDVLRNALEEARRFEIIDRNPSLNIQVGLKRKRIANTWEPDEVRTFLTAADRHHDGLLFRVILTFGLRIGEALGLRWPDIDFERRIVTLNQQLPDSWRSDEPKFAPLKTGQGRWMPIPADTLEQLRAHRREQGDTKHDFDLVFTTSSGAPIRRSRARESLLDIIATARVPKLRIHDLRHTAASLWIRSGMDVQTVSARLGHVDASTTIRVYMHAMNDRLAQEISLEEMTRE